MSMLHSSLHYTYINVPQAHMTVKEKSYDPITLNLWHDRLGHPGSIIMKMINENTHGHSLKGQKIPQVDEMPLCTSCSHGKLITRPSQLKDEKELPTFLERIQGDICGPIHPSTFAKFLAEIIKLRAHFPDYTIKRVRLDNAGEFTSHAFNDYCISVGIVVEHPVTNVHTQNGLAESLIKRLQLIARPLIMRTKLPVSIWGHAILHVGLLIRIKPTANHKYSPIQLVSGQEPNISHLRIFGCAVYVPIAPPQRTKIGPQRSTFDELVCQFDESVFPSLGGESKNKEKNISWCEPSLSYLDPRTKQCETEVQRIMHLQDIANQLPDAFTDTKRVTKSHIPVVNAPARIDIPNEQNAMQAELNSLNKRTVFGPIVITPKTVKPVGYKLVFVRKRNEKKVTRYKSRVMAQGFSQRPGIDYEETYSPVIDAITFRYVISLAVSENLEMRLMDVVTAYLYGSLDSDIYMKIPEEFKFPEALSSKPKEMYSIKLQRSLYGLKQSRRMWYNRLSDYLISKGYTNNLTCLYVFIKKTTSGYVIIAVYVDDLNIMGTRKEIHEAISLLKNEFEMKDLGKTKYCLGLQIEHMHNGILVHQSLNVNKDPFRPCEDGEDFLGLEVPYLNASGALMYLTNCTRPDISFTVNLLARFNAGYLSDPHKARSQTGYVFKNRGTAISWRSQKQTLVAASSNHAEVIALREASRECVWLRSMTKHISNSCGLERNGSPTPIYEDNAACVSQMKEGYIKSDRTKHIPPRFFSYTQDQINEKQVEMRYVKSSNNSADLFTKALPTETFRKHVHDIGMKAEYTHAWNSISSSIVLPMVLLNAIKLMVLETIAEECPNAQLSSHEIATRLSISNDDAPNKLA
ncbi:hypothetical protein QVD17_16425 [Tagetes erecta]|uniref:Integrase catalytic domain-containing protein n=1 Tax=Tagetes erecta TaxID=13708 RepID=A0AAD8KV59_TARER|nr:hypothetical protein QVD17_16425 [Tagetes erecta]